MSDGEAREEYSSSSPGSAITSNHSPMEHSFDLFSSTECAFGAGFPPDPLCKLNLKETSDFVRAFPVSSKSSRGPVGGSTERRRSSAAAAAAPSTPGRPIFNFSSGNLPPRKSIPSKWDDAEKWLISTTSHFRDSPAHSRLSRQQSSVFKPKLDPYVVDHQKPRFIEEEEELHRASSEVFLKDKFTDNVEPALQDFRHSEPTKEGFLFRSPPSHEAPTKERRDVGTEMTPLGSSTTSRCHTPAKSSSPARHNTPADRSGPLACSNISGGGISGLKECHFAKLDLGAQFDSAVSNWSSREEEEEEVSKSLRHFEASKGRRSIRDDRGATTTTTTTWEDGERTKSCIRYQREEARIQAWVNLQKAKAEARSRKLEVKIQKMRSDLEEKQMKRMAIVHRRAEEWRASAQLQHSQQVLRASEQAQRKKVLQRSHFIDYTSCGCFPCNNHLL